MRNKIIVLSIALVAVTVIFLFFGLSGNWEYMLERRAYKLGALILVSCSIAYSSLVFQTLTHNRILTPSIMGFESVYLLFQSLIVFWYGDKTFQVLTESNNFFVSICMMTGFAGLLYVLIFRREKNNMYLLLLTGLILGTLFNTLSSFVQMLIDSNEFSMIEAKIFASFNQMNIHLFWFAVGAAVLVAVLAFRNHKYLDVIALGRENAINLGIDYNKIVLVFLLIILVLVSVSTALVGPIMFFGILVTNLTYELFKTHKHSVLNLACCLISCITLIIGQFAVEQIFNLNTTISILINFVGGVYFLYVLLKAKKI
jgi:iron complex transport system permease protein